MSLKEVKTLWRGWSEGKDRAGRALPVATQDDSEPCPREAKALRAWRQRRMPVRMSIGKAALSDDAALGARNLERQMGPELRMRYRRAVGFPPTRVWRFTWSKDAQGVVATDRAYNYLHEPVLMRKWLEDTVRELESKTEDGGWTTVVEYLIPLWNMHPILMWIHEDTPQKFMHKAAVLNTLLWAATMPFPGCLLCEEPSHTVNTGVKGTRAICHRCTAFLYGLSPEERSQLGHTLPAHEAVQCQKCYRACRGVAVDASLQPSCLPALCALCLTAPDAVDLVPVPYGLKCVKPVGERTSCLAVMLGMHGIRQCARPPMLGPPEARAPLLWHRLHHAFFHFLMGRDPPACRTLAPASAAVASHGKADNAPAAPGTPPDAASSIPGGPPPLHEAKRKPKKNRRRRRRHRPRKHPSPGPSQPTASPGSTSSASPDCDASRSGSPAAPPPSSDSTN